MDQSEHIKLIEENVRLSAELEAERQKIQSVLEKLSAQVDKISALESEVASLKDQLYWLRKKVFGQMSEKNLPVDPMQLNLFETEPLSEEERNELEQAIEEQEQTITKTITVSKPARKPIDTTKLPVEEINIYPDGTTAEDGYLKDEYVEIGTEETLRMETVPAKVYIVKTIRHKVMLRSDAADKYPEDRKILTPALPLVPIAKCMAGASVLTDIIINKFMYHLPFYRQIQQYREYGVSLNDSTVGGWYEAAVEKLKLLYDLLRQKILSSEYIQVDESVIPVLDDEKLAPEQRMALRKEKSYPVIMAFEKWMQASYPKVSPQSRMGRAIAYTYALLPRLSRYVNDGRINIDNNLIENAIRPLALGRKNYLFCGNDASAYRAAIVYSLIGTCKTAGVEPRQWMEDVLRQMPYYERDGRDLAELLPREWAKTHRR